MPFALTTLWKPAALAIVIATALIYRGVLIHQRDAARVQATTLQNQVADLSASNAAFQSAVARQNAAVEALRQKMGEAEVAAHQREQQLISRGAAIMRSHYQRAVTLQHASVPSDCEGAIKWGNAQGPELGQW
ncbi:MAG: hypothetical protein ACREQN_18895 [Candidatus Binataceae bacterium]